MKRLLLPLSACLVAVALYCIAPVVFAAENEPAPANVETTAAEQTQADAETSVSEPASPAPVEADYHIAEEDVLQMSVWGEPQLTNIQMQVTPDGKINVPYIGDMQAAGLTQYELTSNIADAFEEKDILINANVQLTLVNIHRPTVRVWGAVNRPGEVYFKEGDRVMDAIAGAGSYAPDNAWLEMATLTRKDSDKPISIDLKKMVEGDFSDNLELQKGDTIYVPTEDYQNKFYVLGQVYRPGIYDLKDNTTVLSAISLAGGPTQRGVLRSTVVVRGDPEKPERVACDLTRLFDKADLTQDITLQPGDVVLVPESKRPDWQKVSQILNSLLSVSYLRRYGLF